MLQSLFNKAVAAAMSFLESLVPGAPAEPPADPAPTPEVTAVSSAPEEPEEGTASTVDSTTKSPTTTNVTTSASPTSANRTTEEETKESPATTTEEETTDEPSPAAPPPPPGIIVEDRMGDLYADVEDRFANLYEEWDESKWENPYAEPEPWTPYPDEPEDPAETAEPKPNPEPSEPAPAPSEETGQDEPRTIDDMSVEQKNYLAGAALVEMINQYREANGAHPLYGSGYFNELALQWNHQMAQTGNFAHSPSSYGWTGEIITNFETPGNKRPEDLTPEEWADIAREAFERFYNSDGGHNEQMLDIGFSSAGVDVFVDENGTSWVTVMFFTDMNDAYGSPSQYQDKATSDMYSAYGEILSYAPNGFATRSLGLDSTWSAPADTRGVAVSYPEGSSRQAMNRSAYFNSGTDPRVTVQSGGGPVEGGVPQPEPQPEEQPQPGQPDNNYDYDFTNPEPQPEPDPETDWNYGGDYDFTNPEPQPEPDPETDWNYGGDYDFTNPEPQPEPEPEPEQPVDQSYQFDDFNELQRADIAAASLVEMINQYRDGVGTHRLYSAPYFNELAREWNEEMSRRDQLVHSPLSYGRTGEIIVTVNVPGWKANPSGKDDWNQIVQEAFEKFYYSNSGHNASMLKTGFSAAGSDMYVDGRGEVWVTVMFFSDHNDKFGSYSSFQDEATIKLYESGASDYAYDPDGSAMEKLGLNENWQAPWDTRGHQSYYENGYTRDDLDMTKYFPYGTDPNTLYPKG